MNSLSITEKYLLDTVSKISKSKKYTVYIVGGILRDHLLKREKERKDFDFCLQKGAMNLAKDLARKIKGAFIVLDRERGIYRVVYGKAGKKYSLDFNNFRAPSLEEDLKKRDFTINAFAVEIDNFLNKDLEKNIRDPFNGLVDLRNKIIRTFSKESFLDDPLRILRAFSLKAQLGFRIEMHTLNFIKSLRKYLTGVSYERIRDELVKILFTEESYSVLKEMFNLGILDIIIPDLRQMDKVAQGPYHHLDVLSHSFETLKQLEILLNNVKADSDLYNYMHEYISGDHKRFVLLKLAAFLHDIGKPEAKILRSGKIIFHGHELKGVKKIRKICYSLKLSSRESQMLETIIMWHLRPGYLADMEVLTKKALFRFFRDASDDAPSILLLSIADQRSTRGPLTAGANRVHHEKTCIKLIKKYFDTKKQKPIIPLINGHDLISKLKLKEGPLVGKVLKKVFELQALGKIKTKSEALSAAKKIATAKKREKL
ncbi:MAG: HD domain-containing protein [Candidatus Omnitrophota bacterium]